GDLVGRFGGEEFAIYLHEVSELEAALLAESIREGVQDIAFNAGQNQHMLSVSIGVAAKTGPSSFDQLLRLADQQLYAAKAKGRNCVASAAVETVELSAAA